MLDDKEEMKTRSEMHVNISLNLMFIAFTIFTFIVAINQDMLKNDPVLAAQLAMSIPFFMGSIQARSKQAHHADSKRLENFGYVCFIFAYGFLINTVGILLATFINIYVSIAFFIVNCLIAVLYSDIIIGMYQMRNLKQRLLKDSFFISFILILGLLHAVGVY